MGKYQDVECPICGKPLENGEVVVVCPDCGAPYHRDCVTREGKCIYTQLHEEGKSWEMPRKEVKFDGNAPKRCTRCGTINPINGLFCEVCGTPLNQPEQKESPQGQQPPVRPNMGQPSGQNSMGNPQQPGGAYRQYPPHQMAYDPFTTPFGGVNPDEDIDEIPVRDWAIYIGQNTQYFIPKFKDMSENKRNSFFNFAAAVFGGFYFLYRKMFLWGALLLVVTLILRIPSLLISFDLLREMFNNAEPIFTSAAIQNMSTLCSFLSLVLAMAMGFFTNRLYKSHCHSKISKIRKEVTEHSAYVQTLTKNGSVSRVVIFVILGGYLLLYMVGVVTMMAGIGY